MQKQNVVVHTRDGSSAMEGAQALTRAAPWLDVGQRPRHVRAHRDDMCRTGTSIGQKTQVWSPGAGKGDRD